MKERKNISFKAQMADASFYLSVSSKARGRQDGQRPFLMGFLLESSGHPPHSLSIPKAVFSNYSAMAVALASARIH